MIRRLLLFLGHLTDFDRDGAKVLLVVAAINITFIALILWPGVERRLFDTSCNSQCQAESDRFLNDIFGPDGPPTPDWQREIDKIIDDVSR